MKPTYAYANAIVTRLPARAARVMSMSKLNLSHLPRTKSLTPRLPYAQLLGRFHLAPAALFNQQPQPPHQVCTQRQHCRLAGCKAQVGKHIAAGLGDLRIRIGFPAPTVGMGLKSDGISPS
jgi:hypothetical protein